VPRGSAATADTDDRFVRERTDHSTVALIIIIRILMAVERSSLKPAPESGSSREPVLSFSLSFSLSFDRLTLAVQRGQEETRGRARMSPPPVLLKILGISDIKCTTALGPRISREGERRVLAALLRSSRRAPPAEPFNHGPKIGLSELFTVVGVHARCRFVVSSRTSLGAAFDESVR